jgi:hypothetical protein
MNLPVNMVIYTEMKIVINEQQSSRMVEIIRKIVSSTIDFEGGVKDFEVIIPNPNFPFPMYDVILYLDEDWIRENEFHVQQYIRNVRAGVGDKIKSMTGLDVYVGTKMK